MTTRVIVNMNEQSANRVFIRFADADAKKRAVKVLAKAVQEAPVGKTGALRRGLRMSQSRDVRGRWSTGYDVISTADHTLYVIKGTKPHKIVPKEQGGVLAFFWKQGGGLVFFRSVNHPGTRANNFLSRALRAAR